jgi:hypothetical protein
VDGDQAALAQCQSALDCDPAGSLFHAETHAESWIQATMAGGIGGFHKAQAGVLEGDAHHHPVVAMEPDRHHPLKLALSRGFRQSATSLWGPI